MSHLRIPGFEQPGVVFDALDPVLRKWYVPQELYTEYGWRPREYSNYARDLYQARSPINHVQSLSCPAIFFQGLEDKVVPPAQAEAMVAVLAERGIPHAYVPFEGEQHGFRRAENIRTALDGELYFYSRIFGFEAPRPDAVRVVEPS